jgi:serine/threonine-protein kinase
MSEEGGVPHQITSVDDSALENSHVWPQLLPDEKSVIFTVVGPSGGWDAASIVVQDIVSGERHAVIEKGTYGRFVSTGHIIYAQANGTILAVPFDLDRKQVTGPPFTVASGVRVGTWGGAASFTVADGGTFAFVRGTSETQDLLHWVDREGKVVRQLGPPLSGDYPSVSPDGSRIALTVWKPNHNDIWLVDTVSGERDRFTFESTEDESPIWSPDGERIAYSSAWTGQTRRVYVKSVDGRSEPELLYTGKYHLHLTSWSPDGKWLAFYQYHPESSTDVWLVSTDGEEELVQVTATAASEADAVFSPDGRWLAYHSDETGRPEVYAVSFPELGAKRQVSQNGGSYAHWSARGDELFYLAPTADLMAVTMRGEGLSLKSGAPKLVFPDSESSIPGGTVARRLFAVAPDGRHFSILAANPDALAREIHVVLNWFTELRAGGPTGNR